jgi:anthraniloyl-CoA monooxygenase
MKLDDVSVIGGGPAGLFAAILVKRGWPGAEVAVFERSVPDDTFGFGVAFTRRTLELLAAADDAVVRGLRDASVAMPRQEIRVGGRSVFSSGNDGAIGVARSALLTALAEIARGLGVQVELGHAVTLDEVRGADLVIAADGVGSEVRTRLADEFSPQVTPGRGLFMWLGLDRRLESNLFAPARSADGLFNVHCYPYAADRSTIGVETDAETWHRARMDQWTRDTPADESDKRSIEYLQNLFGPVLGGTLLGNRSRWMRFRTVTTARWSTGNTVLLGDAAHTAHYSVGSGTKMAMEDAVGLVSALQNPAHPTLADALAGYEAARRPRVERIQDLADRSRWWWETLGHRLDLPPAALMLAYLSRGGAVSAAQLAGTEPGVVAEALAETGLGPLEGVLDTPVTAGGRTFPSRVLHGLTGTTLAADIRDPWGDEAAAFAAAARTCGDVIVLTGPARRERLLDRLALAENVRYRAGVPVAVEADPAYTDDVVDAVIAGRIDLVRFTPPTGPARASTEDPR